MVSGNKVNPQEELVPYSSKIQPDTKELLDNLVIVLKSGKNLTERPKYYIASQRELIEDMLRVYEQEYPELFKLARAITSVYGG